MSVAGKWNVTIKAPTGPQATLLELHETEGKITGSQTGQGMTTEITGATFDGSKLFWIQHITKPMKMKLEFTAAVDGAQMSGKVKAGFMGSYSFTATRT
ncbi:MAG: hypothetical protein ACREXY_04495 [Gammaproteobacteria bacterium]